MDSIIKLEGVDFYYDRGKPAEVHALKDVNLEINPGEYVSFFGPSGCGKSTILYAIAGIERPDAGKIIVNGQDLMNFSQRELAIYRQIGIGIVFQNFNLIPSIKNIDNVTLPMAFLGISADRRKERAMQIFERLGIAELIDRYPYELSGGQQQRVGIARALANDPPILLADEPLGNLDSANANNVLDLLREFNEKDGKTIIIVTHEAWSLRDIGKVFYMRDGAITQTEIRREEILKKAGIGHYNKKLFPELPTIEVRVKTLAALVLRGFPQPEVKRLEYFLIKRFKDQIDGDVLRQVLDRPYKDGGVGLWKQKAKKISDNIEGVLKEEKELGELYKKIEKNPEAPLISDVEKIRDWLLEGLTAKLTPLQLDRLDESVSERIRNIITADNFINVLDLTKTQGGVGLKIGTSFKVSEKLEMIMGREEIINFKF